MKKLFKFIIGIVGFVIAVAIILLIIVGVLLFDNKNNGEKINATTEDVVSSLNYNALDSTKENDELSYTFDVLTLNSLLGTISSNIKLDPVQITNMYTTFNNLEDDDEENDTITLYIPLKLFFYETCLISTMNIVENEDTFTLVISQAKVGRVDSNFFLIKETLDKAFKPSLVEDQLKKVGFNTECVLQASIKTAVPIILVSRKTPGFSIERSTWLSAAKLTTISGCSSSNSFSTASLLVMLSFTNLKFGLSITGASVDMFPAYVRQSRHIIL